MSKVLLIHENNLKKEVKIGFSWTVFFFGFFVPLIRGDLKWAVIMFLLAFLLGYFTYGVGGVIVGLIFSFKYNKIYIKDLLLKGYKPVTKEEGLKLANNGMYY